MDEEIKFSLEDILIPHPTIPGRFCVGEAAYWEAIREDESIETAKKILEGEKWREELRRG